MPATIGMASTNSHASVQESPVAPLISADTDEKKNANRKNKPKTSTTSGIKNYLIVDPPIPKNTDTGDSSVIELCEETQPAENPPNNSETGANGRTKRKRAAPQRFSELYCDKDAAKTPSQITANFSDDSSNQATAANAAPFLAILKQAPELNPGKKRKHKKLDDRKSSSKVNVAGIQHSTLMSLLKKDGAKDEAVRRLEQNKPDPKHTPIYVECEDTVSGNNAVPVPKVEIAKKPKVEEILPDVFPKKTHIGVEVTNVSSATYDESLQSEVQPTISNMTHLIPTFPGILSRILEQTKDKQEETANTIRPRYPPPITKSIATLWEAIHLLKLHWKTDSADQEHLQEESQQNIEPDFTVSSQETRDKDMSVLKENFGHQYSSVQGYDLWTERYKPMQPKHVICGGDSAMQLSAWLSQWKGETKNSELVPLIVLVGEAGTGKSASIFAAAQLYGFNVIEINTLKLSDPISKRQTLSSISEASQSHNLPGYGVGLQTQQKSIFSSFIPTSGQTGANVDSDLDERGGTIIVVEEVDLWISDDMGFMNSLKSLCLSSKRPIIFTCNELTSAIKDNFVFHQIDFRKITNNPLYTDRFILHLRMMLLAEGVGRNISVTEEQALLDQLRELTLIMNGDIRKIINNLQLWVQGGDHFNGTIIAYLNNQAGKNIQTLDSQHQVPYLVPLMLPMPSLVHEHFKQNIAKSTHSCQKLTALKLLFHHLLDYPEESSKETEHSDIELEELVFLSDELSRIDLWERADCNIEDQDRELEKSLYANPYIPDSYCSMLMNRCSFLSLDNARKNSPKCFVNRMLSSNEHLQLNPNNTELKLFPKYVWGAGAASLFEQQIAMENICAFENERKELGMTRRFRHHFAQAATAATEYAEDVKREGKMLKLDLHGREIASSMIKEEDAWFEENVLPLLVSQQLKSQNESAEVSDANSEQPLILSEEEQRDTEMVLDQPQEDVASNMNHQSNQNCVVGAPNIGNEQICVDIDFSGPEITDTKMCTNNNDNSRDH